MYKKAPGPKKFSRRPGVFLVIRDYQLFLLTILVFSSSNFAMVLLDNGSSWDCQVSVFKYSEKFRCFFLRGIVIFSVCVIVISFFINCFSNPNNIWILRWFFLFYWVDKFVIKCTNLLYFAWNYSIIYAIVINDHLFGSEKSWMEDI